MRHFDIPEVIASWYGCCTAAYVGAVLEHKGASPSFTVQDVGVEPGGLVSLEAVFDLG